MLSQMFRQLFADNPLAAFPVFALVIFISVFAAVVLSVTRTKASAFDEAARIPLDDGGES